MAGEIYRSWVMGPLAPERKKRVRIRDQIQDILESQSRCFQSRHRRLAFDETVPHLGWSPRSRVPIFCVIGLLVSRPTSLTMRSKQS